MGAGDVKLMAAIGSVVGRAMIINIIVVSYIAILPLCIFIILFKGDFFKLLKRYQILFRGLLKGLWLYHKPDASEAAGFRLPMAPAIVFATFLVFYTDIYSARQLTDLCRF